MEESDIKKPLPGASFHGECWFRCPKCKKAFEFWDTRYAGSFKHIEGNIYEHLENGCGQLIDMT